MNISLMQIFSELPDARRGEGKRHDLAMCYSIIVMSLISGYNGIKPFGQFVNNNYAELIKYFQPKHDRLPSYSTLRRVLLRTNFIELEKAFNKWANQYQDMASKDVYSIDGKSIRSTITDSENNLQNFASIVSIFSQNTKKVVMQSSYENKKVSEINVVYAMLSNYNIDGKTFTLDALHCQKNSGLD